MVQTGFVILQGLVSQNIFLQWPDEAKPLLFCSIHSSETHWQVLCAVSECFIVLFGSCSLVTPPCYIAKPACNTNLFTPSNLAVTLVRSGTGRWFRRILS